MCNAVCASNCRIVYKPYFTIFSLSLFFLYKHLFFFLTPIPYFLFYKMKAEYCVDYLSYKWNTDDLIQTYRETRKYSIICKLNHDKHEDYKHKRLQNALWREMARNCTSNLSQPNKLVDPSSVSW